MRRKSFLLASRIRVELIRRTGRRVFAYMVQGRLVEVGYRRRHIDWCPKPTVHRCHHHMLADRPQNCNHQHWSHAIFDDESRAHLYYRPDRRAREFYLFLGCKNPPAFQQHDEKLGYAHYSRRGWLWTHQQLAHATNADGSSSGACGPTCGGGGAPCTRISLGHRPGWRSWAISSCD